MLSNQSCSVQQDSLPVDCYTAKRAIAYLTCIRTKPHQDKLHKLEGNLRPSVLPQVQATRPFASLITDDSRIPSAEHTYNRCTHCLLLQAAGSHLHLSDQQ